MINPNSEQCSFNYKNVSKLRFVYDFSKIVSWSTNKTRRVNVILDITVRGFTSKFIDRPLILPLLPSFLSPPRSTECVSAASVVSFEPFYT